jgi:outer membrane protein assembly factor BamB
MQPLLTFWIYFLTIVIISLSCTSKQEGWERTFREIGTLSSPRATDLNGDGVKDIILAAGANEFEATDSALFAINGRNGKVLWAIGASDQLFGTPVLLDINDDQIRDVIISGRSGQLMAVNGSNGALLWDFKQDQEPDFVLYNFYTPALVSDQNDDGLADMLVAQGGDVRKKPHEQDRPAGMLMLLSASDGKVLATDTMPDGKETYMSPVVYQNSGQEWILFGSGGETIAGNFYQLSLADFKNSGTQKAELLVQGSAKGFIAPPVLADLNRDGQSDILVNAVEGRLLALDGVTGKLLWEYAQDSMEVYTSPAVGNFNGDATPDVFVNFGKGIWPDLIQCRQIAVDGTSGRLLFEDSLSFFSMSSPVTLDVNADGLEEALLSINFRVEKQFGEGMSFSNEVHNKLMAFDVVHQQALRLEIEMPGPNPAITPLLDDLDNDGKTDLILAYHTDAYHMGQFNGMKLIRKELDIPLPGGQARGYLLQKPFSKKATPDTGMAFTVLQYF